MTEIILEDMTNTTQKEHKAANGAVENGVGDGTESKADEEVTEKKDEDKDKEVLLIQDTGFNIQIIAPNLEPFELPVSTFYLYYFWSILCVT